MSDILKCYRSTGKKIYDKLRLKTFPVAVKHIREIKIIPKNFKRPSANNEKWGLCQAFNRARVLGMRIAMTEDDNVCPAASAAYHWVDISDQEFNKNVVLNEWYKNLEARKKRLAYDAEWRKDKKLKGLRGMLISPLTKTNFVPDTILFYGLPAQILNIVHTFTYEGNHIVTSVFAGYGESCLKGALKPFVTGKPELLLLGYGDRKIAGVADDEIGLGIPGRLIFDIDKNLFRAGGKLNLGMPIKTGLYVHRCCHPTSYRGHTYLEERIKKKSKQK